MEQQNIFQKIWKYVAVAFAVLIGLFMFERGRRKEAEATLNQATNEQDNAVTQARIEELNKKLQEEKERIEKEKQKQMTDKEREEYLKRL